MAPALLAWLTTARRFLLLPTLTAMENITLPMDFGRTWSLAERRERAMHLLEWVGMADLVQEARRELFEIREGILALMDRFRGRS